MKDLNEIREEIDYVDRQILELYEKRLNLACDVAEYKISVGKKVYDKEREVAKLNVLGDMAKDDFSRQGIIELYEQIMCNSRKKQYQILSAHGMGEKTDFECVDSFDFTGKTICYQGVAGAYSQQAMNTFFKEAANNSFNVESWRDAMEAVSNGKADYAVFPIENSSAGSVSENYDLLMEYDDLAIIGEQIININHALLGVPGAKIEDITKVYSHPQAIYQCINYIREKHIDWDVTALRNTAFAAQKVSEDKDIHQAAIGSRLNADIYGLEVIEENIQDNNSNATRFIIVTKKKEFLSTAGKISICLEINNEKGSLYHTLSHFIFNGLDLCSIQSRPIPGETWKYRFFIDFNGNLNEDSVTNALLGLRSECSMVRVLGNY